MPNTFKYFVATHTALIVATCWSLLFNGFVGFQWIEDGTALSLWVNIFSIRFERKLNSIN